MDISRDLLRLPPWEALIAMINRRYGLHLNPKSTSLAELEPVDATRVEVTLVSHRSTSKRNLLPPIEQETFIYQRLDLATFFDATATPVVLNWPSRPYSTLDIVRAIQDRTDIIFDQDDVIHEVIPAGVTTYALRAHPRSLRWVGELPLSLPLGA